MDTLVVCQKCESLNRVNLAQGQRARPICGRCQTELPIHNGVQDLTRSTLNVLIRKSKQPVVVDFWAPWCAPCRAFAPTYQEAAKELGDRLIFGKLDTEAHSDAGGAFSIRGIPTLIIFKGGKEFDRQSGAMPREMLLDYLKKILPLS